MQYSGHSAILVPLKVHASVHKEKSYWVSNVLKNILSCKYISLYTDQLQNRFKQKFAIPYIRFWFLPQKIFLPSALIECQNCIQYRSDVLFSLRCLSLLQYCKTLPAALTFQHPDIIYSNCNSSWNHQPGECSKRSVHLLPTCSQVAHNETHK